MNRSLYIEYDYDEEEEDSANDLYTEYFYGDYDETFEPPPEKTVPVASSSNPFGVDLNFDDYELSDIRNVEFEYDYDYDYNDNEVSTGDDSTDEDLISDYDDNDNDDDDDDEGKYKYKLIKGPTESIILTPTQLKYMGIQKENTEKRIKTIQKQVKPQRIVRRPLKKSRPSRPTTPLHQLVHFFQRKVDSIAEAIRKQIRLPRVLG